MMPIYERDPELQAELKDDIQKGQLFKEVEISAEKKQVGFFELAANFRMTYPQSSVCLRRIDQLYAEVVRKVPMRIFKLKGRIPIRSSTQSFYETGEYFESGETILTTPSKPITSPDSKWESQLFALAITSDGSKKGWVWMDEVFDGGVKEAPPTPPHATTALEAGFGMLKDMAVAAAPHVADATIDLAAALDKGSEHNSVSTATTGAGEIEFETGATGWLSMPCTDTGTAVRLSDKTSKSCTTFSSGSCVISDLPPGRYKVSAKRSGGCEVKTKGPVEIILETGQKVHVKLRFE